MNEMVNLVVDLREEQFGGDALALALRGIESAGFTVEQVSPGADAFLAWIDDRFGGAWSSEAFAGKNIVAKRDGAYAGFVTFDPRGLKFSWLRGLALEKGVGIFGPFGVAQEFRGSPIGPHLLAAALAALRREGYSRAIVPAVGHEKLVAYYERHAGARVAERFKKSQWQRRKFRTVVLASGSGSNFQSVVDRIAQGTLPLDIAMLLSNKPGAFALNRAREAGIYAVALPWDRAAQSRAEYDAALLQMAQREEPDLILLLGWMHVLDDAFVRTFPEMINIHPAFLPLDQRRDDVGFPDGSTTPAFRGAFAVRDALTWGSRWVGASSHRVTLEEDRGPVLARKPLAVAEGEDRAQIMERLHPLEHRMLATGIMRWVYERSP